MISFLTKLTRRPYAWTPRDPGNAWQKVIYFNSDNVGREENNNTDTGRESGAYSLRQRYLFVTALMTLLLLGFIWLAHYYVDRYTLHHKENMEQRSLTTHTVRLLRDSIMQIEQNLELFLWSPDEKRRHEIKHGIDTALLYFGQLKEQTWLESIGHANDLGDFGIDIQALYASLGQVMDKRNEIRSRIIGGAGESNELINTIPTLQRNIKPQFEHLWEYLRTLDQNINNNATKDATELAHIADTIMRGIWLLAIAALCLIIIGFLYFERGVLKPIALVARALKEEADGRSSIELPRAHSLESQQLIDAFAEMRFQVQDRQRALEQQALHDSLTNLPNRFFWQSALDKQCKAAKEKQNSLGVLIIGLDRFKEINDTLGHPIGDRVLQLVGERLKYLLRGEDTLARLGSDEFAISLPDCGQEEAVYIARKILEEMERPFQIEQINLYVVCSIGVALSPQISNSAEELTRHASIAMYAAKRHKSGYTLYDHKYDIHSVHKLSLATDLRNAIQNNSLYLVFQPQQSLRTLRCSGLEVLLRWDHPFHGLVRPDEFIPIAEQTGLIHPLTTWVLDNTFAQMAAWRKQQLDSGIVSINISVFNLQSPDFIGTLKSLLDKWGIAAEKVMLEITETAMMADPTHAKATLDQIDHLGVKLAIDDFGTGFSSLAYLKQLPVHELKIDKSFVTEMTTDENDAVIVRSTIDMAHNLGLRVVAEGVESQEVKDLLEILDCDVIQGYHLSKPLPAAEVAKWLSPLNAKGKIRHIKEFR